MPWTPMLLKIYKAVEDSFTTPILTQVPCMDIVVAFATHR